MSAAKKHPRSSRCGVKPKIDPYLSWYEIAPSPSLAQFEASQVIKNPESIRLLHDYGKKLLAEEVTHFAESKLHKESSNHFMEMVMGSGTLSDRVGALTLAVQESPLHNMNALQTLVAMSAKRNRGQALEALAALKDLFCGMRILPNDRKLLLFAQLSCSIEPARIGGWRPGMVLPSPLDPQLLILWTFEDWLKTIFHKVVQLLEYWASDQIVYAREKSIESITALLDAKPEQEENLLRLLINKLGDNEKKVASKASFNILRLESAHPAMLDTIITYLEHEAVFRPDQKLQMRYYAIITLNQTVLSSKNSNTANTLLGIYFTLFMSLIQPSRPVSISNKSKYHKPLPRKESASKERIKSKGRVDEGEDGGLCEKLKSAVLTGLNRALPFARDQESLFPKYNDILYKMSSSPNFSTALQAMTLIRQIQQNSGESDYRFQCTLYSMLLDTRLQKSSRHAAFLNLIHKALHADTNLQRCAAYRKRCVQVAVHQQQSLACGLLYLSNELSLPSSPVITKKSAFDSHEEVLALKNTSSVGDFAEESMVAEKYNGYDRVPDHARAHGAPLWESTLMTHHFHPSVALFAQCLIDGKTKPPKPDLGLVTLTHFLDRFVYRKPKSSNKGNASLVRGHSIMQPIVSLDRSDSLILASQRKVKARTYQAVNSREFVENSIEHIRPDEVFFHKYFSTCPRAQGHVTTNATLHPSDEPDTFEVDDQSMTGQDLDQSDLSIVDSAEFDFSDPDDLTAAYPEDMDSIMDSSDGSETAISEIVAPPSKSWDHEPKSYDAAEVKSESISRKRKKVAHPTFASIEDYEHLLQSDSES